MVDNKGTTDVVTDDTDSDVDDADASKTYDAEYVKKLKAEAKEYRQGKAALKKEKEEIEARLKALEDEKLSETEKDKKKISELEKQLTDIQGSIKQKDIDNLILKSVSGKNIIDLDTASILVKNELSGEEEITDQVVLKAVDKLIKDKPYLISSTTPNPSNGNFSKTNNEAKKTGVDALAKLLDRYKG
jgi:hypothetical protein